MKGPKQSNPVNVKGCLFTCFNTRAVHIEMLHSLDADEILLALGRFISRRTAPEKLYSDKGSNFVQAHKELREAFDSWENDTKIDKQLTQRSIQWSFQPPSASHMGGGMGATNSLSTQDPFLYYRSTDNQ